MGTVPGALIIEPKHQLPVEIREDEQGPWIVSEVDQASAAIVPRNIEWNGQIKPIEFLCRIRPNQTFKDTPIIKSQMKLPLLHFYLLFFLLPTYITKAAQSAV